MTIRHKTYIVCNTLLISLSTFLVCSSSKHIEAAENAPTVRAEIRREFDDIAVASNAGLEVADDGSSIFITSGAAPDEIIEYDLNGDRLDTIPISGGLVSRQSFDVTNQAVTIVRQGANGRPERVRGGAGPPVITDEDPAFESATGFALLGDTVYTVEDRTVVATKPAGRSGNSQIRRFDLSDVAVGDFVSITVDPTTDLIYAGDALGNQVLVIDDRGRLQQILDLSEVPASFQSIAIARSSDITDGNAISLYLLTDQGASSAVVELRTQVFVPDVVAATVDTATLVQQISGNSLPPPSPDSSGVSWASDLQLLVMVDSEVNEYSYYDDVNMWHLDLNGNISSPGTGTTFDWSREPTGIAYDAANNRVFTSDDNRRVIYEVAFGPDGISGTSDDVVTREFDTTAYGNTDPEGLFYDASNNRLFISDGANSEVFVINAGANGNIDGGGDDIITQFDAEGSGVRDPEGIAYNSSTGTLTLLDYRRLIASEFTVLGSLVRDIELPAGSIVHPAGGTWAPSSTGTGQSLWVTDRGVDASSPIDGQLVEFSVPGGGPPDPEADISVTPSSVDFGPVSVEGFELADVLIANVGTEVLTVSDISITGDNEFSIESGGGQVSLNPGDSHLVTIAFAPTVAGAFAGSLVVTSDDPDEPTVSVTLDGAGFESSGTVTLESLVSGGSTSSTTVSAVVTVMPGDAYVATVASKPDRPVIGVTGLGGTWSQVDAQCGARSATGVSVWISTNAVSSGTVTATTARAPSNALMTVAGYSGVNLANPVGAFVSANTLGVDGACSGGSDASSYSFGLTTTAPGSLVVGAIADRNRTHNEGPGWTEVFEDSQGSGGGTAGLALVEQAVASPSAVTVSGTFSANVDWAAIAFELKAGG